MAREHHSGRVFGDPAEQLRIAKEALATPADRRIGRRRVIDPEPVFGTIGAGRLELRADLGHGLRTVPPGAEGEIGVVDADGFPIGRNAKALERRQPAGLALAIGAEHIQIVIARADQEPGLLPDTPQIGEDDDDLRAGIDAGGNIEQVPRDDHEVVVGGDLHHPVELRQRIMQVCDQEDLHPHTSPEPSSRKAPRRALPHLTPWLVMRH